MNVSPHCLQVHGLNLFVLVLSKHSRLQNFGRVLL